MSEGKTEKIARQRSRLYPRYDLKEAVNFAKALSDLGGYGISTSALAAGVGKGVNNSTFTGRVSSAKQFGLIVDQKGKLSISDVAKRILFPRNEEESREALNMAFQRPALYRDLIQGFKGRVLPEVSSLSNLLFHDYGIEAHAKERAARNFLASAEYAGLIRNGILVVEAVEEREPETEEVNTPNRSREGVSTSKHSSQEMFTLEFGGGIVLSIPRNETTTAALVDGKLSDVKIKLEKFAEDFLETDKHTTSQVAEKEVSLENSEIETATS